MSHSLPYVISALRLHFLVLHEIRMHRLQSCDRWAQDHGISPRRVTAIIEDLRTAGAEIVYDRCLMRYNIYNDYDESSLKEYMLMCMDS